MVQGLLNAEEYIRLPDESGVYKFFNKENNIIYVGKAKNIKKRVASYFNQIQSQSRKTRKLVSEIVYIEFTVATSEFDALLLENNLIKENQPKYNILLKDDKSFPFILVTREAFPKIYPTRRVKPEWGSYFGPYSSVKAMKAVLDLIRKLYKVRTCNLPLHPSSIAKNKFKVCLEYHIGNCLGPCVGVQSLDSYQSEIEQAKQILKGNIQIIKNSFKEQMIDASNQMRFEEAQKLKEKIELLDKFQTKSLVVHPSLTEVDVITILLSESKYYLNYMKIDEGAIRASETVLVESKMEETEQEILQYVLERLQVKYQSTNLNILTNIQIEDAFHYQFTKPQIGDKRKLIDLSLLNILEYKKGKISKEDLNSQKIIRLLEEIRNTLYLSSLPKRIECFDNSNIQGTNPVAAMACFIDGKPAKKEYRHFMIKTVVGPDDFTSMKEIIYRRYHRVLTEKLDLPDLIVIDGGKGQLHSACESLKQLNIYGKIPIIGIAKKLEEIYYPEDSIPLLINKKSQTLKVLQHIRDETHRFAVTFHRKKRSQNSFISALENINGIGPKTRDQLILKFKTVKGIKEAKEEEVIELIGSRKTKILFQNIK